VSKLTNFPPSSAALRRAGVDPTRRGFDTLVGQVRRERETSRIVALRALQALRAHQRTITGAAAQRAVSDSDLVGALKLGLADPAPIVRAQALFAFENAATDPDLLTDLAATLGDENWLVRLAGLEVLTGLQGPIFRPVVESLARSDPDDLVRRLAQLYLQRWSPPAR
jgi:HEAT repeat protein